MIKVDDYSLYDYIEERYSLKFPEYLDNFEKDLKLYNSIPNFKINQNIYDVVEKHNYNERVLYIARVAAQYYIEKAFKAMKIDLTDPNVEEELNQGNIGTPGRIAKMWTASSLDDDSEFLCGRWTKKPRLASFPNTNTNTKIPITKRITIDSVCSHHMAPFSTKFAEDSYAIVSYVPEDLVLGISKLQRITEWISRRGWLQEDLTYALWEKVSDAAKTENVYVKIVQSNKRAKQASHIFGFNSFNYGRMLHFQLSRLTCIMVPCRK
jgi:GTP cyclohydrolase I